MTLYNLYIFNEKGECIYYKEWRRDRKREITQEGEFKLVFGMLHSLRSVAQKIATRDGNQVIRYFRTSGYKMNYFETPTGLKVVVNSDPDAVGIPDLLRGIFAIYVETVVKNPLIDRTAKIESLLFHTRVDDLVRTNAAFV